MHAWCPLEEDAFNCAPQHVLEGVSDFSVFVRIGVSYPDFGLHLTNYDGGTLRAGYNLFKVADILRSAGFNVRDVLCLGAVVALNVVWDCDIDAYTPGSDNSQCQPTFSYARLDAAGTGVSTGYNYREAEYWKSDGVTYRDVTKRAGLLLVVNVKGMGRQFSWPLLLWNCLEVVAMLGVARFICDFLLSCLVDSVWCGPLIGHLEQTDIELRRHQGELPRMGLKTHGNNPAVHDRIKIDSDSDSDESAEFERRHTRPALQ